MRHNRSHTRAQGDPDDIGITTDTDETSTWNTLDLETQAYQAQLEGHRLDPDNPELYHDMLKARATMQLAWLEHTIVTKGPVPLPPVSRAVFAKAFLIAGLSYFRTTVLRSGAHRRKPRR